MTDYFIWYLENKNFKKDSQLGIIVPPPTPCSFGILQCRNQFIDFWEIGSLSKFRFINLGKTVNIWIEAAAQIWLVLLKIVLNFSRFKPAFNWNRVLADLSRGLNSLNSDTELIKLDKFLLRQSIVHSVVDLFIYFPILIIPFLTSDGLTFWNL